MAKKKRKQKAIHHEANGHIKKPKPLGAWGWVGIFTVAFALMQIFGLI